MASLVHASSAQVTCGTQGGGTVFVPGSRGGDKKADECSNCGPVPCIQQSTGDCWSCCHDIGGGQIELYPYCCEAAINDECSTEDPTTDPSSPCYIRPPPPPPPPPPPWNPPSPPPSPGPSPDPDPPPSPDPASSGGTWTVSVWYKVVGTPDCTSDPDATVTFTTAACNCLIEVGSDCFASATLDVSSGDTVTADVYAGGGCAGEALGGDTEIACDTCTPQTILTGGVALQITCPFDWTYVVLGLILLIVACGGWCVCRRQTGRPEMLPPAAWSQVAQQGIPRQAILTTPLLLPQPAVAPQTRSRAESLSKSNGPPPEGSVAYTATFRSVIRSGVSPKSTQVGTAEVGETIIVLESGISSTGAARVKCDRGWFSVRATDGTILLQESQTLTRSQKQAILKAQLVRFHTSRLVALGFSSDQVTVELTGLDNKLIRLANAFFEKQSALNEQLLKQ